MFVEARLRGIQVHDKPKGRCFSFYSNDWISKAVPNYRWLGVAVVGHQTELLNRQVKTRIGT